MKLLPQALALSMCCSALSACQQRVAVNIPIPDERMDCVALDDRPEIPPEYSIDWTRVVTVAQAQAEHQAFVTRLRAREMAVAGYVIQLEGVLFACANDAEWLRDYSARLPE